MGTTVGPKEYRKLMFTRCFNCMTVFHITAAELRAADGTVICGTCGTTFDALESLSETRPKDPPADLARPAEPDTPPAEPDTPPTEPDTPPATDELARDEDEFLEELESLIGSEPAEDEVPSAQEEHDMPGADDLAPMAAAEQPLHDEELADEMRAQRDVPGEGIGDDEFLVEDFDAEEAPDEVTASEDDDENRYTDIPDPDAVFQLDDLPDQPYIFTLEQPTAAGAQDSTGPAGATDIPGDDAAAAQARGGLEAEPDGAGTEPEPVPEFARESRRGRTWLHLLLALVAVLALAGTWAHTQHGKLLRHSTGQAVLGPIYSLLGIAATPDWNPAEFRAVQWEAIANPDQPDDLIVAVDFVNSASYAQPYPAIRIVLEDRFGRRIGIHDVSPYQYRQAHSVDDRLPAGGRVRTTVTVPDPGARADGFRVDFCLELQGHGLACGPEPFR